VPKHRSDHRHYQINAISFGQFRPLDTACGQAETPETAPIPAALDGIWSIVSHPTRKAVIERTRLFFAAVNQQIAKITEPFLNRHEVQVSTA
jgi:hypothetical protein